MLSRGHSRAELNGLAGKVAVQVGIAPTTLELTAPCSAAELLDKAHDGAGHNKSAEHRENRAASNDHHESHGRDVSVAVVDCLSDPVHGTKYPTNWYPRGDSHPCDPRAQGDSVNAKVVNWSPVPVTLRSDEDENLIS